MVILYKFRLNIDLSNNFADKIIIFLEKG